MKHFGACLVIRLETGGFNSVAISQLGPMGATRTGNQVQVHLFDCRGLYRLEGFACRNEKVAKAVESEFNMVVREINLKD